MRLPWWPIYLDVRFDEHGVYYTIADESERLSPWHRTRFYVQNKFLVFVPEDEHGNQLQHNQACVLFRINLKDRPGAVKQATELQDAYLEDPQNKYACKVVWRNEAWFQRTTLGLSIGLPLYCLYMMYQGYQSAPDNEPGFRFQNGMLVSMAAFVLIALLIYWRVFKELGHLHQSARIIEINQRGVMTSDLDYQWDDIERINPLFANYLVTTHSGKKLILPNNGCATWILRNRISHPPVLSRTLFVLCLIGSVLSGPIFSAWFGYLAPEYEQPFSFWGVSLMLTGAVLAIYGAIYFMIWQAKRQALKSQ